MASNKRDLKAYVRYDGNGRLISGSLILQRFKPKVGNWVEIDAYECCNPTTSTTTSTTTETPATTTTTTTEALSTLRFYYNGSAAFLGASVNGVPVTVVSGSFGPWGPGFPDVIATTNQSGNCTVQVTMDTGSSFAIFWEDCGNSGIEFGFSPLTINNVNISPSCFTVSFPLYNAAFGSSVD
jgi:hypothetical protein